MSEDALDAVHRVYARPLALDPDLLSGLAELASADTEFDFTDAYPDGKVVKGVDGVRRIAEDWPWGGLHFEPEGFVDVGAGRILVLIRATATGEGSGIPVERRTAHELTFEDDRLVRFKVYSDRGDALAAAGLREAATEARDQRSSLP
jgi:ketosteroid isomerase-like protein